MGHRLAEAAEDSTLAPWQREFMLEVARGRVEGGATKASPAAGSAAEDGAWTTVPTPTGRSGHTAIYDPVRDRMVVFSGTGGYRNELWALSLAGSPAWSELTPAGSPPSERRWHTAIYDPVRDRMVVFGGLAGSHTQNDVWALSLAGSPAWTALAPAGGLPVRRAFHTAIYDPLRDRMLVFGGWDGNFPLNDVWALSLAGSPAWSALAPSGPSALAGHTSTYDPVRDRMVVFGGHDGSSFRHDVWVLSLAGSPAWSLHTPAGSPPAGRNSHTANFDPLLDRMVVFGGSGPNGRRNDVWALSLGGSPVWSEISSAGSPPSGRDSHSAIYDPLRDRMVVFGGYDGSYRNDVLALSLAGSPAWSVLSPAGSPPSGRDEHTAIYDPVRDRMVVFGGRDSDYSNDVWALSLAESPAWSALTPAGSPPTARKRHTAILDPVRDRLVVFGGYDQIRLCNDVWALSLGGSPAWSEISPAGSQPSGREAHSAIYDPLRDRMVVFGGQAGGSSYNDVWALSLAGSPAWSALAPAGSLPSARYFHSAIYDHVRDRMAVFGGYDGTSLRNDVWALSLGGSPAWSLLTTTGSPPAGRISHTAIYDPLRDRMVVFGGGDPSYRNDVVALSLTGNPAWNSLTPAGNSPQRRTNHAAIYDPVRDRMIVFGGWDGSRSRNDVWTLTWGNPPVPALVSLAHAEAGPDRVSLTWYGSESAGLTASVERRETNIEWQRLATISADGTGTFRYDDRAVVPGARYAYRLSYRDDAGAETVTAETWVEVPVTVSLALEGLRPNPAGGELVAVFALPDDAPAVLAVLDVTGRRVLAREVGSLGAGRHTLRLGHASELPTGIYWLRLERSGRALLAKAIVLR